MHKSVQADSHAPTGSMPTDEDPANIRRNVHFIMHDRKIDNEFGKALDLKYAYSGFDVHLNRWCSMISTVQRRSDTDLRFAFLRYIDKKGEDRLKLTPFPCGRLFVQRPKNTPYSQCALFINIVKLRHHCPRFYSEWGAASLSNEPDCPSPKRQRVESAQMEPSTTRPMLPDAPRASAPPPRVTPKAAPVPSNPWLSRRPEVPCPPLALSETTRMKDEYIRLMENALRAKDQTIAAQAKLLEFLGVKPARKAAA